MMFLVLGIALGLVVGALLGRLLARREEQVLLSSFEGLAARALSGTRAESAEELTRQSGAVAALVEPLRLQLGLVEAQLRGLEVDRARAGAELRQHVEQVRQGSDQLGRQTAALVDALRRPQARGVWGEMQLRRCVEYAGMMARCDFDEQVTLGDQRPDLVVRLAGGRTIVVDAKVTLAAYLEAVETPDETHAAARMAAHARHLRAHVETLAAKDYWSALPHSPEFVVLFVPGESFLGPALEHDPALLEHAYARRVHVATPTTLVSLLRTVAHGWQQHELTENARAVVAAGQELYQRLGTLGGHVDKLGRSLTTTVSDFNKTVGSLERSLLPSARRMAELGVDPTGARSLTVPAHVPDLPRPLSAAELVPPLRDAG